MRYHIKSVIFKRLSKLPENIGNYIYHVLQVFLGNISVEQDFEVKEETYRALINILDKESIDLAEKNILEIGSGWLPTMPYLFKYIGKCNAVFTYDIGEHFNVKRNAKLNAYFSRHYNVCLPETTKANGHLPESIKYFPKTNIIITNPPPPNSIDIVFTRFLLEHVPPEDIYKIHLGARKYLKKNGVLIHFVSPSDHRAYSDSALSLYDFLQYSEKEWERRQTRFDYHNRLRLLQYIDIFKKAEFEIVFLKYSTALNNNLELNKLNNIQIHPDFQAFSLEELTASSLVFILSPLTC